MSNSREKEYKLEEGITRLESILERMENDQDLPLEEALKLFQEGMEILKQCRGALAKAEFRVRLLLEDGQLTDFGEGENGD